ncbi:MAG: hypothetical protein LBE08_13755 [Bifidobacteriaceae bacterium]|nr:hypothetical protein [Bifidobacteriaceae bacterium]
MIRRAIGMPERVWARTMAKGRWTAGDLGGIARALGVCPSVILDGPPCPVASRPGNAQAVA